MAARRAGVPGFLMTNFTWADIYAPYAKALGGDALAAGRRPPAGLPAGDGGLPDRAGHADVRGSRPRSTPAWSSTRRATAAPSCCGSSGLNKVHKLVYLYIGRYGQSDLDWPRLERFAADGHPFPEPSPGPAGGPANLHVVPSPDWPGGDLIASSDAVLAKAGYGTVCEAMASGTPMIYPPRRGFAEFRSLDRALRSWGGGVPISSHDFRAFKLERALDRALHTNPGPAPFPADGATRIARYLTAVCRAPRGRKVSAVAF